MYIFIFIKFEARLLPFDNKRWNKLLFRFGPGQKVLLARRANWRFADQKKEGGGTFKKHSSIGFDKISKIKEKSLVIIEDIINLQKTFAPLKRGRAFGNCLLLLTSGNNPVILEPFTT